MENNFNLIKQLLEDDKEITLNNESVELRKLREVEQKYKIGVDHLKNVIVFWDDVVQFTTLGLVDVLLDEIDIDEEKKNWNFDNYFYRGLELTDPIDFVKHLFKEYFNVSVDEKHILMTYKNKYSDILLRSPVSTIFPILIRSKSIYNSLTFAFRYNFKGIGSFVNSFKSHFPNEVRFRLSYSVWGKFEDEYEYLKNFGGDEDIIYMLNLARGYEYIDECERDSLTLVGPNVHNGIPLEIRDAFYNIFGSANCGPRNSEIVFYNEGVAIC